MSEEARERFLDHWRKLGQDWAKAKGDLSLLENSKHSVKAKLIAMAPQDMKSQAARETWALAHDDYQAHLHGLAAAVHQEAELRMEIERMRMSFEQWRSLNATRREEAKIR